MGYEIPTKTISGINANAATETEAWLIPTIKDVYWVVEALTGSHATHIITLQESLDNTTWYDTASTVTGVSAAITKVSVNAPYIRWKVTTVEGAISTVRVVASGKP